jgi:hypothetical protein
MEPPSAGGAQTSRPDDAGPVRTLLRGMASPAASFTGGGSARTTQLPTTARELMMRAIKGRVSPLGYSLPSQKGCSRPL